MALKTFWTIAYRDLIRNRRRTFTTLLAVALGLTVVLLMAGMLAGMFDSGLRNNIRVVTGHLQLRDDSYEIEKMSLLAQGSHSGSGRPRWPDGGVARGPVGRPCAVDQHDYEHAARINRLADHGH